MPICIPRVDMSGFHLPRTRVSGFWLVGNWVVSFLFEYSPMAKGHSPAVSGTSGGSISAPLSPLPIEDGVHPPHSLCVIFASQ